MGADHRDTALAESLIALASVIDRMPRLDEAGGSYYYDEVEEKRWVTDGGSCEDCEEAADEGWVDMDYTYTMFWEDVDGPPGHPHCACTQEERTRRARVYD